MTFPLASPPAWYTHAVWTNDDQRRGAVFYAGETVTIVLAASGADHYEVRDYYGTTVDSGSVSGTTINLGSSWDPGWYRIYLTGANTDGTYGPSYGATNFSVLRVNPNFLEMPTGAETHVVGWDWWNEGGDLTGEAATPLARGVLGLGTGRLRFYTLAEPGFSNNNPGDPQNDGSWLWKIEQEADYARDWWLANGYEDPARPRYTLTAFVVSVCDILYPPAASGGFLRCYLLDDSLDGTQVFVNVAAGSSSGSKVTVRYPVSSTIVETYDNLADGAAAETAINAASDYIRAFNAGGSGFAAFATTAFGNATRSNAIVAIQAMWARGCTRFEGPTNEPQLTAEAAHAMKLHQQIVHAAQPDAVAVGPCPVDILNITAWETFLDAGGGDYCDEISFHDYNSMTNGNLALGRYTIERFLATLDRHGQAGKMLWQTEANNSFTAVYGVYHPRRARFYMLHTLLWEQYGIARERNPCWYDGSHGFWGYPAWLMNGDGSLEPHGVLLHVLAEETWAQVHDHRLRFGATADTFLLGSLYRGVDGSGTIVLMSTCHMDDLTVDLTVVGAGSVTAVDAFGNQSTLTATDGRVTVPVDEVPTYVRLPVGVSATPYQVNDWGPAPPPSISGKATDLKVGSTFALPIGDDSLMTAYASNAGIYETDDALPQNATLLWPATVDVDRVIVIAGQAWQSAGTLVSFDVQTTANGGGLWTTRQTVTKTTPSSFNFGTDQWNAGCKQETYWDEQWVFDVKLPATYSCNGVRVVANSASYGGEPDAAAMAAGGQGNSNQRICLQEILVPSASLPQTNSVTPKTGNFELGSNGATISTGDTGSLTAWDGVNGSPGYDTAGAIHGTKSMKVSASGDYVDWTLANLTDHYGRLVLRVGSETPYPRIVRFLDGATVNAEIRVSSTIHIADRVDTNMSGIHHFDTERAVRLEYHVIHSATVGQIKLRVFDHETGELLETVTSPATWDTGTKATTVRFGSIVSGALVGWFDDLAAAADGYLGPAAVTAGPESVGSVPI